MFFETKAFNQDIGAWDVNNVTNMMGMFDNAIAFNQDIGAWDVSSVNAMNGMFNQSIAFNQDLSDWCVENSLQPPYFSQVPPLGPYPNRLGYLPIGRSSPSRLLVASTPRRGHRL